MDKESPAREIAPRFHSFTRLVCVLGKVSAMSEVKRPGFDGDSAHLISTSSLALVTPA